MTPDLAADLFKTTVMFALYVVAPFLGLTLVVGVTMSLLQSVTSMQEPTLAFIPKLLSVSGLALLITPWLLRSLAEFAISLFSRMGTMGH